MLSDRYALGIDIGGTNVRFGLVTEEGRLIAYEKHPSSVVSGRNAVEKLYTEIVSYIYRNKAAGVRAVCIGFPATVDKTRTRVLNAPNLLGFDGVPVGTLLSEKLKMPVYIEKDVNLLIGADLFELSCRAENVVACYVGTGIGNAVMVDGKLITGANGVAGELGHIPFGGTEAVCGCGNAGCAETVCGGAYLAKLRDEWFPETEISGLFTCHSGHAKINAYLERLARVIAAEVNIIDPEVLLLGGGVIEMTDFPKKDLEARILSHVRKPLPHDGLKIIYSPAGNGTNGVIGAGIYAWRKIK